MSEIPGPESSLGTGPAKASGYHSRSERRSTRREAQRKRTAGRFLWVAAPVMAVVVVVAALFAFVVTPSASEVADEASTIGSSLASDPAQGSGLLVIEQDGAAVEAALVHAGPRGGIVLAVPGTTLLRRDDRFVQVADLHASGDPKALVGALADALAVPVGPVVSVGWSDLRDSLAEAGVGALPPETLDLGGEDAAQVAAAVALFLAGSGARTGELRWELRSPRGDIDGFRAAVGVVVQGTGGSAWAGEVLPGRLTRDDGLMYVEPDLRTARSMLGATETEGR